MIEVKNTNLFDDLSPLSVIVYQVNLYGLSGAGLAVDIKKKYPEAFDKYYKLCNNTETKTDLLGKCLYTQVDNQTVICAAFGQNDTSWEVCLTDYSAWKKICQNLIETFEKANNRLNYHSKYGHWTIHMPYYIGCGLAGGDVEKMHNIFNKYFKNSNIKVVFHNTSTEAQSVVKF